MSGSEALDLARCGEAGKERALNAGTGERVSCNCQRCWFVAGKAHHLMVGHGPGVEPAVELGGGYGTSEIGSGGFDEEVGDMRWSGAEMLSGESSGGVEGNGCRALGDPLHGVIRQPFYGAGGGPGVAWWGEQTRAAEREHQGEAGVEVDVGEFAGYVLGRG